MALFIYRRLICNIYFYYFTSIDNRKKNKSAFFFEQKETYFLQININWIWWFDNTWCKFKGNRSRFIWHNSNNDLFIDWIEKISLINDCHFFYFLWNLIDRISHFVSVGWYFIWLFFFFITKKKKDDDAKKID